MLKELKRLMHETAIYGLSRIVSRLINVILMPLYTHALVPAEYGLVAIVFTYIAFVKVVYSHGMDFAFMRFYKPQHEPHEAKRTFSTAFWSLAGWSIAASIAVTAFARPIASLIGLPPALTDVVTYSAWIMTCDTICLAPFAYLRMNHKAAAFVGVETFNIVLNVVLNYVFLFTIPMGVRGVFLATLVTSAVTLLVVIPVIVDNLSFSLDRTMYKDMLRFAIPILPAGVASMMVQLVDRPLLQNITHNDALVGIYQANYRLGIFMQLVINTFDAAWRPFYLERSDDPGAHKLIARVMTYFTTGAALLFLAVTLLVPFLVSLPLPGGRTLIHPAYWSGLSVVPVVTLGYLFNGMYYNLLAPVTIVKRSERVTYATAIGALVNVGTNLWWIPRWGMMGAAYATLAAYAAMALSLWLMGRELYPVQYEAGRLAMAAGVTAAVLAGARALGLGMTPERLGLRLALLAAFPVALLAAGFLNVDERSALSARWRATFG